MSIIRDSKNIKEAVDMIQLAVTLISIRGENLDKIREFAQSEFNKKYKN